LVWKSCDQHALGLENSSLTGDFYFSRGAPTRRDDQSPARAPSKTASGEAALAPQSGPPLPQMVRVPAGTFLMGRDDMDPDERPQHPVEIQGFDIGRYEVTFEEYDAFASDTNRARPHDMNWGRGRRPVINVSWQDAAAYVAWLTRETGENYRLPTEAEWEYAAMAGATTHFAFGDQLAEICTHGNGADRDTDFTWRNKHCNDAYRKQTAPVGHFPPNQFGVNDMIGNVWEWVSSCWTNDYRSRADEACQHRVLRGGAWDSSPRHMRGANRSKNRPGSTNHNFGFRVARQ